MVSPYKKGSNKIRNIMTGRGSREYRNFKFDKIKPIKALWEKMEIDLDELLVQCSMLVWDTREVRLLLVYKRYSGGTGKRIMQ